MHQLICIIANNHKYVYIYMVPPTITPGFGEFERCFVQCFVPFLPLVAELEEGGAMCKNACVHTYVM